MLGVIRAARADDYDVFTTLVGELGVDDPTPSEQRFASHIVPRMLVCERHRRVIGYVTYDKLVEAGIVRSLVVAPDARRSGVGAALMMAAAQQLRAHGVTTEWHLNVNAGNAGAIALYERLGLRELYRSVVLRFPWAGGERLPTDDAPVSVRPVADAAVPDLERALGILGGRLALARSRGRGVSLQLRDAKLRPVGVAYFDPLLPGASPFAVARPTLASVLIDALAPHAHTGHLDFQIVVEHDDALADTLIAAGAVVRARMLHYSGPMPQEPEQTP